jgi:tRNA threonylcarbamoyladenosine biosynthesis protein TsaB
MGIIRLLLETSSRTPLVALADGEQIVREQHLEANRRNARDLVPTIAALLKQHHLSPRDLGGVVAGVGPGSYTSLRVGLMTAKTLAYVVGCALIGVPTPAILAAAAGGRVDVLIDAQKDLLYVQSFEDGQPRSELAIVSVEQWLATRQPEALATGPGLAKVKAEVPRTAEPLWSPRAAALLAVGLQTPPSDPFSLVPLYLRPSAAEQQWDARGEAK